MIVVKGEATLVILGKMLGTSNPMLLSIHRRYCKSRYLLVTAYKLSQPLVDGDCFGKDFRVAAEIKPLELRLQDEMNFLDTGLLAVERSR